MAEEQFDRIEVIAAHVVKWATASRGLVIILAILVGWLFLGPLFDFSDDWQSTMMVPTAIITFVLVFLILRSQNKDTRAIQLKLNEIIAALGGANNALIDIENQSEYAIEALHQKYETVAQQIKEDKVEGAVTDAILVHEIVEEIILAEEAGKLLLESGSSQNL